MSSWTQPLCGECWPAWELAQGRTPRRPAVMLTAERETCVACRQETTDGIYVRCDPSAHEPWSAADSQSATPEGHCGAPPDGWRCSRGAGHDGPCAATPEGTDA